MCVEIQQEGNVSVKVRLCTTVTQKSHIERNNLMEEGFILVYGFRISWWGGHGGAE
jgi:hypothetical protein